MTVEELIFNNRNTGVRWEINGEIFTRSHIPEDLLDKDILEWVVNQWEGIIKITLSK